MDVKQKTKVNASNLHTKPKNKEEYEYYKITKCDNIATESESKGCNKKIIRYIKASARNVQIPYEFCSKKCFKDHVLNVDKKEFKDITLYSQ
jgi:hypothetical protein